MVIPILMHFRSFVSNWSITAAPHPTKCDIINDIKLFPTVYHRIYCHKFLMLSKQTSHYKIKCIRMFINNVNIWVEYSNLVKGLYIVPVDRCFHDLLALYVLSLFS